MAVSWENKRRLSREKSVGIEFLPEEVDKKVH